MMNFLHHIRFGDILIFSLAVFLGVYFILKPRNSEKRLVIVEGNGTLYEFDINRNGIFEINGASGVTKIEILEKKVRVIESVCPNKTCVHQGFSDFIACVPNKVVIKTKSADGEFDAVSK